MTQHFKTMSLLLLVIALPRVGTSRPAFGQMPAVRSFWLENEGEVTVRRRLGKPKSQITRADMHRIVEIDPEFMNFLYVVIDDDAKELFAGLTSLNRLIMNDTNFGDEEFKSILSNCEELSSVELSATDITDDVIESVIACQKLELFSFSGTAISNAGYERLETARPDMELFFRPVRPGPILSFPHENVPPEE